jgi:hypothetical protein
MSDGRFLLAVIALNHTAEVLREMGLSHHPQLEREINAVAESKLSLPSISGAPAA